VTQPSQAELWALIAGRREGVLATIKGDGSPQMSNVLYVADHATRTIRISTTATRAKARNLARDPHAALHVVGDDFWHYAAAEADATLSEVATTPGDDPTNELFTVHTTFYGAQDRPAFDHDMISNKRLVIRLHVKHLYGVMASGGRRPANDTD
jgi:PPOX class probable F420-dependent enzyme